jgi:hypothetical protein
MIVRNTDRTQRSFRILIRTLILITYIVITIKSRILVIKLSVQGASESFYNICPNWLANSWQLSIVAEPEVKASSSAMSALGQSNAGLELFFELVSAIIYGPYLITVHVLLN